MPVMNSKATNKVGCRGMAAWRNGNASDHDYGGLDFCLKSNQRTPSSTEFNMLVVSSLCIDTPSNTSGILDAHNQAIATFENCTDH